MLAAVRRHTGSGRPRVLLARNAHFSFEKIVALLPVEPVWLPLDDRYRAEPAAYRRALALTEDAAERRFLERRLAELDGGG